KVLSVKLNEESKTALVEVKEDQLSLAIGKAGQNVRLAAKLTGWKIDIIGEGGTKPQAQKPEIQAAPATQPENETTEKPLAENATVTEAQQPPSTAIPEQPIEPTSPAETAAAPTQKEKDQPAT
ncbi:MAG: hypothetical protein V1685_02580, partial [Parcubacteria group bacterium]